ncbi:MAG TPA: ribose-phosphate pyrophosphokinase, partial [Leptospiraceae bacterium]|nr:ribose-phosphate pyrophosphokinase [Leptospiraceae bacterium]
CKAASALLANGAKSVMCCATHGVLSGKAMDNLNSINFKEIVLSNSINIPSEKKINNLTVLSVAPLFAKAIQRIHNEESISSLFL